jgi:hypothetical protein
MRNERKEIDTKGLDQILSGGKITKETLDKWGACKRDGDYSDEGIRQLTGGKGTTPRGIIDLDIPARDKVWVLLRPEVLGEAYGAIKKKAFPREKGAGIDYDKILAIIAEHI